MDPATATLVLSSVNKAASAASQEAGKQAWQGLVALVRRARRQPDSVVEPTQVDSLTATLLEAAGRDEAFATELLGWIDVVRQCADRTSHVSNTISDGARVTGNVVQARDVTGPITFH